MTRNAMLNLEGFDPDVLEAARDVARRAGVPVETWIASIVEPNGDAALAPVGKHPATATETTAASRPARQTPPRKPRIKAASAQSLPEESSPAPEPVGAPPAVESQGAGIDAVLSEMMRRLDAIDQRIGLGQPASEARSVDADGDAPVESALPPVETQPDHLSARLAEIERRMSEIGDQVTTPRALGRRGRAAGTEVRDAVSEIRQRQRELAGEVTTPPQAEAPRANAPAIAELQSETSRLRDSIAGLASGRDVGALEQAMLTLAACVQKAQAPADLAAIAAPIELIRVQVERLADDVAENVHARVAADVERLAAKVDRAGTATSDDGAGQDAHAGLYRELEEIRRLIAALAGPERIQSLATGLQAISNQISQLREAAPGFAEGGADLRPLLEEIRSGLQSGPDAGLGVQIREMGAKLDALSVPAVFDAKSEAFLHRLDALAEKVERVSINPVGDLIGRLEDLGATLRRPVVPGEDIASIHAMLHDLMVKLDRIGTGDGPREEGLDALEQQVLALAERIDSRAVDPALAGLERTMSELLEQVASLRSDAPIEAAVERATRTAVAETMGKVADSSDFGLLRASLTDLRAHQVASEQRMQSTLTGVYSALERLVGRLGTLEGETGVPMPPRPVREPLPERAGPMIPRQDAVRAERHVALDAGPDLPLEPGAGRPGRERAAESTDAASGSDGDIKSSFIAAARRAAQAAQAEAAGQAVPLEPQDRRASANAPRSEGRLARLRGEIDRRRKPLLLGLAAIVLALGAMQAVTSNRSADDIASVPSETRAVTAPEPARDATVGSAPEAVSDGKTAETKAAETKPADGRATDAKAPDSKAPDAKSSDPKPAAGKPDARVIVDPQTTQALSETPGVAVPGPAPAATVRVSVPRVADMATLSGDLARVPPVLGKLRQATLDGDGTAAYDLASRAAEGRGLPRDVGLATKIFEKLGNAGYAPAQYKLGSLYEKGAGMPRDLAQAKIWYGRAAEHGNARAMHNLAVIHAENPLANGKPDFAAASEWFKRGAEFGLRDSQYNLAVLYARGLGVTQNLEQSYVWFSAATAQGDSDAAKKRDDIASKLDAKALASAKAVAAAFKAKTPEPAANEPPQPLVIESSMSLLGAAPPNPATAPPARRI